MTTKTLTKEKRIELVQRAQEKLLKTIELLERAELSPYVEAYIIDHLKIYASSNHGFCSSETTLDDVLEELENDEDEELELDEERDDEDASPVTPVGFTQSWANTGGR